MTDDRRHRKASLFPCPRITEILIEHTSLNGVLILTPPRISDSRGFFSEVWNKAALTGAGLHLPDFIQQNMSLSHRRGTLRGLHYQAPPHAQGKLVRCGRGRLLDVAVDARRDSASYGRWVSVELSAENGRQLWISAGFLHGFVTLEDDTEVIYNCTSGYNAANDGGVRWDSVGIEWPIDDPVLSPKDAAAIPFDQWVTPFPS